MNQCWLHKKLPIYKRLVKQIWLCVWSAPLSIDEGWINTLRALRITIRSGENHSRILWRIKRGRS